MTSMSQLNLSSSDSSMKTYSIQEKRRTKASERKGTKSYIKDMTSLILMISMDTNGQDDEDIFESYLGAKILLPDQDRNNKMEKVIK